MYFDKQKLLKKRIRLQAKMLLFQLKSICFIETEETIKKRRNPSTRNKKRHGTASYGLQEDKRDRAERIPH